MGHFDLTWLETAITWVTMTFAIVLIAYDIVRHRPRSPL